MQWSRMSVELVPIMAGLLGGRLSQRLPLLLEEGWCGLLRPAAGFNGYPISWRGSPFVLAAAVLGVLAAGPLETSRLLGLAVFLSGMATLALTDLEHRVVPDMLSFPLIGAGVGAAFLGCSLVSVQSALLGTVIGWCCGKVGQVLALAAARLTGQGMTIAAGDVKVLAATCRPKSTRSWRRRRRRQPCQRARFAGTHGCSAVAERW